ncbi:bacterio-opsin activator domain-containing protein [Halovivax sp.]|uniref:helix-turn-helix domain-containing protein n=1 Tax=Halovivax sp. TaxID=1935978 RepID=UPI0025B839FF|nr:bacterio-opsin activator domain-containing protein [Halovivax sp.]
MIITDISVPTASFPLGRLLEEYPDVSIELETMVPLHDSIIPLFWVEDGDEREIEETLREDALTDSVRLLTETDGRTLYEIHWSSDVNSLVQPLIEVGAEILSAEGAADEWDFRLQFRSHEDLDDFRSRCQENEIGIELRRLYNPSVPVEGGPLSIEQRDALVTAYLHGYYKVPREANQTDLSAQIGVSDNALSQRLRRGTARLIEESLFPERRGS